MHNSYIAAECDDLLDLRFSAMNCGDKFQLAIARSFSL